MTLEPCCHWGKTPPCTQHIIDSGIVAVYYAVQDPNPEVNGKGARLLQQAGVGCERIDVPEIQIFYRSYIYWVLHQRPWVTAKLALSLDGKIAGPEGRPTQITGAVLHRHTHQWRRMNDAILTTINTVKKDDPQLNVRLDNTIIKKPIYILDSRLQLSTGSRIIKTARRVVLFHGADCDPARKSARVAAGITCVAVSQDDAGLNLNDVLAHIGDDGVHDLWVECGGQCFRALAEQRLMNRALIYVAPSVLGSDALAAFDQPLSVLAQAKHVTWQSFGRDVVCELLW